MSDKYQITAYHYNTRKQGKNKSIESDWSAPIPQLLQQQHTFLPLSYARGAYLFRGMTHGFFQAVEQGSFGKFKDENPHSAMEEQLNVIFVSHELSDALTCTRPWESDEDFVLLMIKSDYFSEQNQAKNAAVMAFSEPGFIFKYPFFVSDLSLNDISYYVVSTSTAQRLLQDSPQSYANIKDQLIVIDIDELSLPKRKVYEEKLKGIMLEKGVTAASTVDSALFPSA